MGDLEKAEKDLQNEGWVRTAKDLFAGAAGGITQVLLGMLDVSFQCFSMAFCALWRFVVLIGAVTFNSQF